MTATSSLVCAVVSAVREKWAFSVVLEVCYNANVFFFFFCDSFLASFFSSAFVLAFIF